MANLGIGNVMNQMKQQIKQIQAELEALGEPESIPEMIESTNLLRSNEHLSKTNKKKGLTKEAKYKGIGNSWHVTVIKLLIEHYCRIKGLMS